MTAVKLVREPDVAEYEKIRKFIVAQISKAGPHPMRIASTRELAKYFDVSCPTVIKALKDLIADGLLTVKPGIGTFTAPGRIPLPADLKIIGTILGDGKHAFPGRCFWQLLPPFCNNLLERSCKYQTQECFITSSGKEIEKELSMLNLAGFIAVFPNEKITPALGKLKEKNNVPAISIGYRVQGISSLYYDPEASVFNTMNKMLDEGRRRILMVLLDDSDGRSMQNASLEGAHRAIEERNATASANLILLSKRSGKDELAKAIDMLKPDAIIFQTSPQDLLATVKERIDIEDCCRLYAGDLGVFKDMGYTGYIGNTDISQDISPMVDNLLSQLRDPKNAPVLHIPLKIKISFEGARL